MNVTIVGGGIVGCVSAYELARRGCHVDVVDMRGPGLGATQASAGMLAPYIEGHLDAVLRLGIASLEMYDAFIERVSADAKHQVEFRRCGTMQVSRDAATDQRLADAASRLRAMGVTHDLVDGPAAQRLEPAIDPAITSALVIPQHGYVCVRELVGALLAARPDGVTFRTEEVRAIEPGSSGVTMRSNKGSWGADVVVIAAGTWSGSLAGPPVPVRPIRGQLVEVQFASRPFSRVLWGDGCYMVPWCNGAVLIGATSEDAGFDESASDAATRRLLASGRLAVPAVATASLREVRVGLRPATPDELPLIGRSSTMPHIVYATGHYRHGILLAPLTATLVADVVMDATPDPLLELMRPSRFGL